MSKHPITRRRMITGVAGATVLTAWGIRPAVAQSPLAGKTIKLVYPFAAGNAGDLVARILSEQLQRILGATFIVENRTGAAGRVGTQSVIRSAPDGTTLLLAPLPLVSIYPHSYEKLGYDPVVDLLPISQVAVFDVTFVAGPKPGLQSLNELVAWVKANPGLASYGSSGAGGFAHLFAVMFARNAGLTMTHVGYRGSAPVVNDVMAGQIPFASVVSGDCIELHKAGRVRMLAVSGRSRLAIVPDVPTFNEAGIPIDGTAWYGLYAPAQTPADILTALAQAAKTAISEPSARQRLESLALVPTGTTPEELARTQREASALWAPVVAASGFKPDQ
jgi:tripartite-type tricarboxylate transporter receptor subunit TctC